MRCSANIDSKSKFYLNFSINWLLWSTDRLTLCWSGTHGRAVHSFGYSSSRQCMHSCKLSLIHCMVLVAVASLPLHANLINS